jgi:hypothetical protein
MSEIQTITAADAAATPVTHSFVPRRVSGDLATFAEKSASHPSGYWGLGVSLRDPQSGNGSRVYRQKVTFDMPVMATETINGIDVPKVLYTLRFTGDMILPADSTLQNRKDFRKLLVGILDNALVKSTIEDLDPIYG